MASSPISTSLATPSGVLQYHDADAEGTVKTVYGASTKCYAIKVDNSANAAISYLKIFDLATTVTLGTTVPDMIIECNGSGTDGGLTIISFLSGKTFATGFQVAITTTAALAGTTNPASSVILDVIHVPS